MLPVLFLLPEAAIFLVPVPFLFWFLSSSPSGTLILLPPSYEDSYDDTGSTWTTQDNLPISRSHLQSPSCHIRECVHRFQRRGCDHYSASYTRSALVNWKLAMLQAFCTDGHSESLKSPAQSRCVHHAHTYMTSNSEPATPGVPRALPGHQSPLCCVRSRPEVGGSNTLWEQSLAALSDSSWRRTHWPPGPQEGDPRLFCTVPGLSAALSSKCPWDGSFLFHFPFPYPCFLGSYPE